MLKNYARFTATMGTGLKVGAAEVEIKLTLPLKVVQDNFMFLSTNQGGKINVFLGDPQAALDFGEDEDAMYRRFTGRYVTADASGMVTKIEHKEEDVNQGTLFGQELEQGAGEDQGAESEAEGESFGECAEGTADDQTTGDQQEDASIGDDVPDWICEGADDQGMNFTEDEGLAPEGPETGEGTGDDSEISKEKLEEFILQERPSFPDVDLDFPSLVEKRRDGATWLGLSKELGIPSSQLNTKFKKYKDQVKKMMKDNGAA